MCCSNSKKLLRSSDATTTVYDINGRLVLQPTTSNRTPLLERRSLSLPKSISITNQAPNANLKSPHQSIVKRNDKLILPLPLSLPTRCITPKSKKCTHHDQDHDSLVVNHSSSLPGSIAAARREQVAVMQVQRKMRIAHYGRSNSAKYYDHPNCPTPTNVTQEKRCTFITPNSDPIYVAYHDEEWGVPTHDDKVLFELLVLTGAQVGSDWTSVLKKRQQFREAFSGFDEKIVSKYSEKKITSISVDYGIEVSLVRGVVDNSNSILQVNKAFGSFDKYIWGFVNHKAIATQYKSSKRIPVKTSKSESISKDMVRRGFRQVGPTVIHSFMQAVGLTNDHLTTCPRHSSTN